MALSDLELLVRSRFPLLAIPTGDDDRLMRMLGPAAAAAGMDLWRWSVTTGLGPFGGDAVYDTRDLGRALAFLVDRPDPTLSVFADVHPFLEDPVSVRRIKETARRLDRRSTIVLAGPGLRVPPELAGHAERWEPPLPDRDELTDLVVRTTDRLARRGFEFPLGPGLIDEIVDAVRGLTPGQVERSLSRIVLEHGRVSVRDLVAVRAELLADDGVLELVDADGAGFDTVLGADRLKRWLTMRWAASRNAEGIDPPRGVLLTGVPGCGKSAMAKAVAGEMGRPLALLDPARIFDRYLGESERRMAAALRTADALAPAVLWIDEIEKGFAGTSDHDGGAASRALGSFLRWLQERRSDTFVVATANAIDRLPPELLRKGRFDEIFFFDLPSPEVREQILRSHLDRRGATIGDLTPVVAATDGFSGAELEALAVSAVYRSAAEGIPVDAAMVLEEAAATVPLAVSRPAEIASIRTWASRAATAA